MLLLLPPQEVLEAETAEIVAATEAMDVMIREHVLVERDEVLEEARLKSREEKLTYERKRPMCCGVLF